MFFHTTSAAFAPSPVFAKIEATIGDAALVPPNTAQPTAFVLESP